MFTIVQIKAAHSKVKSGKDFPNYIKDLKKLGVTNYETFVSDGLTNYYGEHDYKATSPAWYDALTIAETANTLRFKTDLLAHQNGKTDYTTFCKDTSNAGIEKWIVCMQKMTCTYYDKAGNSILAEEIPQ